MTARQAAALFGGLTLSLIVGQAMAWTVLCCSSGAFEVLFT
jgi:hypothetical protein